MYGIQRVWLQVLSSICLKLRFRPNFFGSSHAGKAFFFEDNGRFVYLHDSNNFAVSGKAGNQ